MNQFFSFSEQQKIFEKLIFKDVGQHLVNFVDLTNMPNNNKKKYLDGNTKP